MSENPAYEPEGAPEAPAEPVRTGVGEVDSVLEAVEALEGSPVDDHVAVFEQAHEQLRRALDARPDA